MFQWKHYSMKFRLCHKHSQRPSESFQPRFSSCGFLIFEIKITEHESEISMRYGNFQTSLAQFLEGVRTNQRYHDDRTDVLVLSAKSDRNLIFRIWDFNEDFESEISMKILKCCFFFQRISTKIETKSHFQKFWFFWPKIPFYRKSHFTWRNLARFGKPIIPFYRDPILSRMYCNTLSRLTIRDFGLKLKGGIIK